MSPSRPFGRGGLNFFALSPWTPARFADLKPAKIVPMDFAHFTSHQWLLSILAAALVGLGKSGFGGVGALSVALMAIVMAGHEGESTGVILPLLICGDFFAIHAFWRHVRWPLLRRLLPPALLGVLCGYAWLRLSGGVALKPMIGWTVLALVALQLLRQLTPQWFRRVPHTWWFAWTLGIVAGITTMLANAAGPVMALYFLAVELPKMELVATSAWFFLFINLFKLPLSANLGFIQSGSLCFNAALIPFVGLGIVAGRLLLHRIDQGIFERLLLFLTVLTALHLIFN